MEALLAASPRAAPEIRDAIDHIAGEVALEEVALGATSPQRRSLYECLTDVPAFENEQPMAVLTRMALGELPRLRHRARGLPEPLEAVPEHRRILALAESCPG